MYHLLPCENLDKLEIGRRLGRTSFSATYCTCVSYNSLFQVRIHFQYLILQTIKKYSLLVELNQHKSRMDRNSKEINLAKLNSLPFSSYRLFIASKLMSSQRTIFSLLQWCNLSRFSFTSIYTRLNHRWIRYEK